MNNVTLKHRYTMKIKCLARRIVKSKLLGVDRHLLFVNSLGLPQLMLTKNKSNVKSVVELCLHCKATQIIYSTA